MQATDLFDGYYLHEKWADPDEREEIKWEVADRVRDDPRYSRELMKRVTNNIETSECCFIRLISHADTIGISAFSSTVSSLRPDSWDTKAVAKWPNFIRLPHKPGDSSFPSDQPSQAKDTVSRAADQCAAETAKTTPGAKQSSTLGVMQVSPSSSVAQPNTSAVKTANIATDSPGAPQRSTTPPPSSASDSSGSAGSAVGREVAGVFSIPSSVATANTSVASSAAETVATTIPSTEASKSAEENSSLPISTTSDTSAVPKKPSNSVPSPPPTVHSGNHNPLDSLPGPSPVLPSGVMPQTDPNTSGTTEDSQSRWRKSVLDELDRRVKRPAGLLKAMEGENPT